MLDIQKIRNNIDEVAQNLAKRGLIFDQDLFLSLENKRKQLQIETESLQSMRNQSAKEIGAAKSKGEDVTEKLAKGI